MTKRIFPAINVLLAAFFIIQVSGCSLFSDKGSPVPTVTVTETVFVTVTPGGKPQSGGIDTSSKEVITPPGQAYKLTGEFTDIEKHPDKKIIMDLARKGFITGFSDGRFEPGRPISRAVYVLWLYNAAGCKTPLADAESPTFPDLPRDHWLYQIIEGMVEIGGFKGYPDNTFRPDEFLTRQEWCVISSFFAADPQYVIDTVDTFPDHFKLCKYNDAAKVSKPNRNFVEHACASQWCETVFGRNLRKAPFNPDKPVTRAEAAKFIYEFQGSLKVN
ncbi:MAG: S-layer homology domain-containing protein [Firmicutes bacterium]|nr:S-layer homology domain-containing protein [Bacillota bacterium]